MPIFKLVIQNACPTNGTAVYSYCAPSFEGPIVRAALIDFLFLFFCLFIPSRRRFSLSPQMVHFHMSLAFLIFCPAWKLLPILAAFNRLKVWANTMLSLHHYQYHNIAVIIRQQKASRIGLQILAPLTSKGPFL